MSNVSSYVEVEIVKFVFIIVIRLKAFGDFVIKELIFLMNWQEKMSLST